MAFLDNSGDIILDAVLTDTGRMRLARGDGSFRIAKFALSDDEIDYGLYRGSSHPDGAHPSGSAYYDLEIMQTPVLEAFTNNTSLMKHKLISMPQTNLLYLPVVKLNNKTTGTAPVQFTVDLATSTITNLANQSGDDPTNGVFILAADQSTKTKLSTSFEGINVISGVTDGDTAEFVKIDQGLDTLERPAAETLSPELRETQYIVRADDRLLKLVSKASASKNFSFRDDDSIASYYLSKSVDSQYIMDLGSANPDNTEADNAVQHVIRGPRGTTLEFSLLASMDIRSSSHLFKTLGGSATLKDSSNNNYYFIDTSIRVSGATTGSSIDVPVRIMKYYE